MHPSNETGRLIGAMLIGAGLLMLVPMLPDALKFIGEVAQLTIGRRSATVTAPIGCTPLLYKSPPPGAPGCVEELPAPKEAQRK